MPNNIFEQIKKINEYGQEYWSARDLMAPLGYARWENFDVAISRAKESCKNSGQNIEDHFRGVTKMIKIATNTTKEAPREIQDYDLSRYACYLIAQNGDPRKEEIALAQTYFVIQTRRQEVHDIEIEDNKRLFLRGEMKTHNKNLASAAKNAGVMNYGNFQDFGYAGLYGGLRQRDIHAKKQLQKNEAILDHMGSEELAANLFRTTQAEAKLKREKIFGENKANFAHYDVGKKVRQTIKELGGAMPEELPTPENIKQSAKRLKQATKKLLPKKK
ncbi:MAG: DNA damage-inducible protein D [Candidatus Gribaldobacteria bacterium]|nr:DNA damage-inducible protein D [Candidatus Gribaldobacteria bacterium]